MELEEAKALVKRYAFIQGVPGDLGKMPTMEALLILVGILIRDIGSLQKRVKELEGPDKQI